MPDMSSYVAGVKRITLEVAAQTFRTGFCMAPQVHLFYEPEDEYLGYVSCRDYQRGHDAVTAVEHMGAIASAMCATRLLVVWEESDLRTSIYGPSAHAYPNGLALLDVSLTNHHMTWYPFHYTNDHGQLPSLTATFDIRWGQPAVQVDVDLLPGITGLIGAWRTELMTARTETWIQAIIDGALAAGYTIRPTMN